MKKYVYSESSSYDDWNWRFVWTCQTKYNWSVDYEFNIYKEPIKTKLWYLIVWNVIIKWKNFLKPIEKPIFQNELKWKKVYWTTLYKWFYFNVSKVLSDIDYYKYSVKFSEHIETMEDNIDVLQEWSDSIYDTLPF